MREITRGAGVGTNLLNNISDIYNGMRHPIQAIYIIFIYFLCPEADYHFSLSARAKSDITKASLHTYIEYFSLHCYRVNCAGKEREAQLLSLPQTIGESPRCCCTRKTQFCHNNRMYMQKKSTTTMGHSKGYRELPVKQKREILGALLGAIVDGELPWVATEKLHEIWALAREASGQIKELIARRQPPFGPGRISLHLAQARSASIWPRPDQPPFGSGRINPHLAHLAQARSWS